MKRVACFAHYDKDGVIQDYVLYYLAALKELCDQIVFLSDGALREGEEAKLDQLASIVLAEKHGEYDFGSYKRAFALIEDVGTYDELIFCNDSCYGPVYPFSEVFDKMKSLDFWGITQHSDHQTHLQSYFLVFRRSVFMHPSFVSWVQAITQQASVLDVILEYEVRLTPYLESLGFKWDSYIHSEGKNDPLCYWKSLLKKRCPLIKTRLFKEYYYSRESLLVWKGSFAKAGYPTDLISKHKQIGVIDYIFYKYIFQKKTTRSNKLIIKVLKIPVWSAKLKPTKLS